MRKLLERHLARPLPECPDLILVTDLDGTLLAGPDGWRRALYAWLAIESQRVLHVFCTGRDLRSVEALLRAEVRQGLRSPHLIIGDVGCTVACGTSLRPIPLLVDPIEALWRGVPERVAPLLRGVPGLSAQPVSSVRRLAYTIDPEILDRDGLVGIEVHGVDCLVSGDRFLDVLPRGVNKGSTLLALLRWLEVETGRVVTAGDSLNDLSMFATGLQSVMVGNAEPALLAALPRLPHTYRAAADGCEGIIEGLHHFGFGGLMASALP